LSSECDSQAKTGATEISTLVETIQQIEASSKRMSEIISAIDDIAFQTNLLALNAAVEAARAGEQGKGFAVVADAVRSLAQRSTVSAQEIKTLINNNESVAKQGVHRVSSASSTIEVIKNSVNKITNINNEISESTNEQTVGLNHINKAMNELDQASQNNAASSEKLASSAEELKSQADNLEQAIENLTRLIEGADADLGPVKKRAA
ncbi:MAG TPA: methyl-accepting chemotaxis protein, partial [Pseudobdellovibrionaceae bacterium]|nr:methyl-accepting chemotaxis protein [Pseudobdellovibrionaceae bacterium]